MGGELNISHAFILTENAIAAGGVDDIERVLHGQVKAICDALRLPEEDRPAGAPDWTTWRTTFTVREPADVDGDGRFLLHIESRLDFATGASSATEILARRLAEAQRAQQMLADIDAADEDD